MRKIYLPLLVTLVLLLAGIGVFAEPARAQDLGPNLPANSGFGNIPAHPYANIGFFSNLSGLFAPDKTAAMADQAAAPAQLNQIVAAPVRQAATVAAPTPRADGAIVHVVQTGDSLWGIAIQYASFLGMTPEEALPYLRELNNNPTFINPGDEILIQVGNAATATPEATAESTTEATPGEDTAATTPAAETTPGAETEGTAVEATVESVPVEELAGTICVAAFDDVNADGQRNEGEALVANAAIAIARGETTVSTYITDGVSEPFCFELTQADSYQLQLYPPAGFSSTTEDNWAVSIANGESYTVSFGLTAAPVVSAASDSEQVDAAEDEAATAEEAAPAESEGIGNLGLIVMGVAAVLVIIAVVGVVLLRRG